MTQELPKFEDLVDRKKLPPFETLQTVERPAVTAAIDSQTPVAPQYSGEQKQARKRNPRARKAQPLEVFRERHTAGHALFYRYKRMQDPIYPSLVGPRGGACILVNFLNDDSFAFSYSVCSPKDAFIKDESRRLCQERFDKGETILVSQRDIGLSCFDNILEAIYNFEDKLDDGGPKLSFNKADNFNESNLSLLRTAIEHYLTIEPKFKTIPFAADLPF